MRALPRLLAGLLIVVLVFGATYWLLDRSDDSERSATRGPAVTAPADTAPPDTAAPTTAPTTAPPVTTPPTTLPPGLPLPLVPRPARLVWAGDSVAGTLAASIAAEGAVRGIEVVTKTTPGCGMLRGLPADDALAPIEFVRVCDAAVPPNQDGIAAAGGDVVTWLSTWDTANRIVDGVPYRFGTPEADAMTLQLIDESAQRLTAGGARLVILTVAPPTTAPRRPVVTDEDNARALHLNELYRTYAAAHADRVAVLDLMPLVCPGGPPCPTDVEGVALRPEDGGHFAGDGPAWLAPRILDRLAG